MKAFKAKQVSAALMAAALLAAAAGCGAPAAVPAGVSALAEPEGILITAAAPARGNMALDTSFVGSVQPDQVVSVLPKLMGTVEKIHVTVGQQVKKGDLLLTIDQKDVLPSFNQAQAAFNSAKAQTEQMVGSNFKTSMANLDGSYDSAYDSYENAQYQRDQLAQQQKDIPGQIAALQAQIDALNQNDPNYATDTAALNLQILQLQKTAASLPDAIYRAENGVDTARKYYNNARSMYNAMKTEGGAEIQNVADATLAQAEAGLAVAQAQMDNTKLYAPIDGTIETIGAVELNMLSNAAPAFIISNKTALMVSFNVPSASIAAMQTGDTVTVQKGQHSYPATITEASTIVDAKTGLFTVKASLETAPPDLLTGVMVKVTAPTEKAENAILVAQDSVYFDNGKAYLYLATPEGTAKKVFVETGISNPEQIEIVSGISDTDLVITSWHPNLLDGVKITLAS